MTFFLFKTCFLLILVGISGISVLLPVFVEHHPLYLGFHLCQQQFLGAELCSQQQATDTDAEQRDPGRWVSEFRLSWIPPAFPVFVAHSPESRCFC